MNPFQVYVPNMEGGQVGKACNRIIENAFDSWVGIMDADVLLDTHPNWDAVCRRAIQDHPETGIFTCVTNNIYGLPQKRLDAPQSHDILEHRAFAKQVWDEHGMTLEPVLKPISGFFMLFNRDKAREWGMFPGVGQFKEDNEFSRRCLAAGHPIYLLKGLYMYHKRWRDKATASFIEGEITACHLSKGSRDKPRKHWTRPRKVRGVGQ